MTADRWQVSTQAAGVRIDTYLARAYGKPRNQVQKWLDAGRVEVDGSPVRASFRLTEGQQIACRPLQKTQEGILAPEGGSLDLLHEDDDVLVIDKPANLVVHPGAGRETGTLVHRLLHHYPQIDAVGGPGRPGIVHRLDRGTSGVMVVARSERAYEALSAAFAERRVGKTYLAVVYGPLALESGRIEAPIGRHPQRRKEMHVSERGRPAVTGYRVRAVAPESGVSLLELALETGRTHQIRVHLKHLGHPIVGDPVYGEARWRGLARPLQEPLRRFSRPALHAWKLAFRHPATHDEMSFEAPLARDVAELWKELGGDPEGYR